MSGDAAGVLAACHIHGRLGEGGIAEVFLAEWEGRQIALKLLRRSGNAGLVRRFLREGRLLQRIDHPHIVRCLHVVEGESPALLLELLTGESLDRRLARGPLSAVEAERVAVAILDALAYIHEDGIIHRDVKASNVWWGADGRVVLMDLGLAADSADPLTTTLGEVVGTYAYMAPEQILGAPSDHRCDLYSLGITLYEALTGGRPYQARGLDGYLAAHRSGRAVLLSRRCPSLPLRLTTLVDRLMARDPAARPASARVALAMLHTEPPARGTLGRPPLVGREAAKGAVAAVLDEGGVLWLVGGPWAGQGAVARMAHSLAAEEGVEAIQARLGPRQGLPDVLGNLIAGLERFGMGADAAPESVAGAIRDLAREAEAGRRHGRFLVVLEDLDLAVPEVSAWVAGWANAPGLAVVATGVTPQGLAGRVVQLRPLRPEETRLLVGGLLRTSALPTGLDVRIHAVTSGQPGWIVQLVQEGVSRRWLTMDGWNSTGEPSWRWDVTASAPSFANAGAPDTRILERLSGPSRRLVDLLAVAGTALPVHVLVQAGGGTHPGWISRSR